MNVATHSLNLHANLLIVNAVGVLITGKPGIGKTALSLGLVDRGHSLVADDVVDMTLENQILMGSSPTLRPCLWLPEMGMLDIQHIFGPTATTAKTPIHLIIHLTQYHKYHANQDPRYPHREIVTLLDTPISQYTLSVNRHPNLALSVETLMRMHVIKEPAATHPL